MSSHLELNIIPMFRAIFCNKFMVIVRTHYKESGLKVDDYCAQHGLSRNAYFYWLRKVKEAALTQSGFVEVRQQVEVSSCYPSPKLTASVNEVVLGIDENTPMDLLANVIKVLKNA